MKSVELSTKSNPLITIIIAAVSSITINIAVVSSVRQISVSSSIIGVSGSTISKQGPRIQPRKQRVHETKNILININ